MNDELEEIYTLREPWIGQHFQYRTSNTIEEFVTRLITGKFGKIWEVTRLVWLDDEELIIHFVNVLCPGDTLVVNWLDLDDELEPFDH